MLARRVRVNSRAAPIEMPPRGGSIRLGWWIVFFGIVAGIAVQQAGWQIEGPALAILGFAPLMIAIDRDLMPGFFIGPAGFMYVSHLFGWAVGPVGQLHIAEWVNFFEHGFMLSQWAVVLGLMTFGIVYPLAFRGAARWSDRHLVRTEEAEGDWQRYSFLLLFVTFLVMIYGVYVGIGNRWLGSELTFTGAQQTIFSAFGYVEQAMFFFLGYQAARRRGKSTLLWLMVLAGRTIFSLTQGGRGAVVIAGIASALGLVLGGVSRRKILAVGALVAIPFVPLAGIVDVYRSSGTYAVAGQDFGQQLTAFRAASSDFWNDAAVNSHSSEIFLRRVTAEVSDRVFDMTPSVIPFAGFESIENVPWVFVPIVLAPDRPNLSDGNQLAIQYGAGAGEAGRLGFYMTTVGDAYRRFGWAGIPLFYAAAGGGTALVAGLAWSRRKRRHWMATLVFATIQAPWIMSAPMITLFWTLLWSFPKYIVFFWILRVLQERLWKAQSAPLARSTGGGPPALVSSLARDRY